MADAWANQLITSLCARDENALFVDHHPAVLRAVGESDELVLLFDDGPTFLYAVAGSTDGWRLDGQ